MTTKTTLGSDEFSVTLSLYTKLGPLGQQKIFPFVFPI